MTNAMPGSRGHVSDHTYKLLAISAVILLTVGTVAYRLLEDWSWVDSFYFSAVAVTTVGFGDLKPTGNGSKLFTVLYIFAGIGLITSYLNARTHRRTTLKASLSRELIDPDDDDVE